MHGIPGMAGIMQQQRALRYLQSGPPRSTRETFGRVWQYVRKYRGPFAIGSALMLVGVVIGIIPPLLIRQMIDVAIPHHDFRLALLLGAGLLLVPFSGAVLTLGQNFLASVVAQGIIADLRQKLYDHTQSLGKRSPSSTSRPRSESSSERSCTWTSNERSNVPSSSHPTA